ncbi:MAG: restriction endonuclease [Bauldia sp.]|nr:restriction endonuclease [Bauldia sp.]
MIQRTVLEWGRIAYGAGAAEIPSGLADRIAAVASSSPLGGRGGGDILIHGRTALQAKQVVGVIAADGCSLEILPKIANLTTGDVRRQLVHMLGVAIDVDVAAGRVADLDWQRDDLLEILIRLFARKLADAAREGLPRRYVGIEEDLPVLRGRLDLKRQFTTHVASPQILACRYDALSADVPINRVMKAAVTRLSRWARTAETQRLLRELAFDFAEVRDVDPSTLLEEIVLDRTNSRWRELLVLARLLLGSRFQTTSSGAGRGFSLLFPMNDLFEEYVSRMLGRALRPYGLSVTAQGGLRHCLIEPETGATRFQTRPDIIVRRGSDIVWVIDTKWKRLSPRIDDAKQGVAQGDVYQMMAYGQVYGCRHLMLLYPHHEDLGTDDRRLANYQVAGADRVLSIATFDVSRRRGMLDRLRLLTEVG